MIDQSGRTGLMTQCADIAFSSSRADNPNYYSTDFSDIDDVTLTWSTFGYYGDLGTSSYEGSFTVSSGGAKVVPFVVEVLPASIPFITQQCLQNPWLDIRWSGSAKAEYWAGGSYTTRIGFTVRYYC